MHSIKTTLNHPLARGMIAYSVLWPTGSIIQQTINGRRPGEYDWAKCARFSAYGALFVAPTLYAWVRFAGHLFPRQSFGTAVSKALTEQLSYGPASAVCFFFGMSLLESQDLQLARQEVCQKLWPTYKVALCYWPFISTISFAFVPERHRIVLLSVCSLAWTTFLAHMKQLEQDRELALRAEQHQNRGGESLTISPVRDDSNILRIKLESSGLTRNESI